MNDNKHHFSMYERTLEEKSSNSLSLAIRRPDDIIARRANVGEAGWNAAAYFSAERATAAIIVEEKGAMVSFRCVQAEWLCADIMINVRDGGWRS